MASLQTQERLLGAAGRRVRRVAHARSSVRRARRAGPRRGVPAVPGGRAAGRVAGVAAARHRGSGLGPGGGPRKAEKESTMQQRSVRVFLSALAGALAACGGTETTGCSLDRDCASGTYCSATLGCAGSRATAHAQGARREQTVVLRSPAHWQSGARFVPEAVRSPTFPNARIAARRRIVGKPDSVATARTASRVCR